MNQGDVAARLGGVSFRRLQFQVIVELSERIVVLAGQFEDTRQVVICVAPPGSDSQSLVQQIDRLLKIIGRARLLDQQRRLKKKADARPRGWEEAS
jgi:hypothetical protein